MEPLTCEPVVPPVEGGGGLVPAGGGGLVSSGGELASTGAEVLPLVLVAVLLIGVGVLLVWRRRVRVGVVAGVLVAATLVGLGSSTTASAAPAESCTASISGVVWQEAAGPDGIRAPGEPLLADVQVTLRNAAGSAVSETTTDRDGAFRFDGLGAGEYVVLFPTSGHGGFTIPDQGGDDTVDSDARPPQGETDVLVLGVGEQLSGVDAGYLSAAPPVPQRGAITGYFWWDYNEDGTQDDAIPRRGMVITAYRAGAPVATGATAADGTYRMDFLEAGAYDLLVGFDPEGGTMTTPDVGPDNADSDADPATRYITDVEVVAGEVTSNVDVGFIPPKDGEVTGGVWSDVVRNGTHDQTLDPGIAGVPVELYDSSDNLIGTTATAGNGGYSFLGVRRGDYYVVFPAAVAGETLVLPGTLGDLHASIPDPTTGRTQNFFVDGMATRNGVNALYQDPLTAQIGGRTWWDDDFNGVRGPGEALFPGILDAGMVVTLYQDGNQVAQATTDAEGQYLFEGLPAGTYEVGFPSFALTTQNVGPDETDSDPDLLTGRVTVTLAAGQAQLDVDAGYFMG